jgi:acyl dehydratase
MGKRVVGNPGDLRGLVGQEVATSSWFEITQERINRFAEATEDPQWIHVEPERAKRESPYGTTIAHGFLTLSLLSPLLKDSLEIQSGVRMGINYGLNRVRFPSAVPAGSKIRSRLTLQALREVPNAMEVTWAATLDVEGTKNPCCVAEWIVRYYE